MTPDTICFSFDVEWATEEAIRDTCTLLDERGVKGTFFVTHEGVSVPGHERAIHPNYRRNGDVYRSLTDATSRSDAEVHRHVLSTTMGFAPESKGVRSHSLYFDSALLPIYKALGIEYDSTYRLELVPGLRPFWKQYGIVEIPAYYADFYDLVTSATGFELRGMLLDQPGMKVLDFHPNLIYTNAPDLEFYEKTKAYYHDAQQLLEGRYPGRGTRTLFIELLDYAAGKAHCTATLQQVNDAWRTQ